MRYLLLAIALCACPVFGAEEGAPPPTRMLEVVPLPVVKQKLTELTRKYQRELEARDDYIRQLEDALDRARTLDRNCGA